MKIRADGLRKTYGWVTALNDVCLDIELGQIVAILGPNGAGKTTLLNALAGVILLDRGQVLFDGQRYAPDRVDLRRRFAFLPDTPPVPGNWSPLRFIGTTLRLYEAPLNGIEDRVLELLAELDLTGVARWRFRQLSRGQSYKAVLAAFLAADPEVWFVDEPFASGMDPRGLNCFKSYALGAARRGRTIVFTTQIIEVAEQLAHRICVIDQGQVRADQKSGKVGDDSAVTVLLGKLQGKPEA